jgi:hypothetical protein
MSRPGRPCARCIKRGHAHSCVNGHRKKAKYLFGVEDRGTWISNFLCGHLTRSPELNVAPNNFVSRNQTPASTRPQTRMYKLLYRQTPTNMSTATTPEAADHTQTDGPIFVASGQTTPNRGDLNPQDPSFDFSLFEAIVGANPAVSGPQPLLSVSH